MGPPPLYFVDEVRPSRVQDAASLPFWAGDKRALRDLLDEAPRLRN